MSLNDDTLQFGGTLEKSSPQSATSGISSHSTSQLDDMEMMPTIRQQAGMGNFVFSRYQLERVLGRGGMGIVWLANDTKLDRKVALKFLPDIIGADPAALKELKEETKRGLDLAHPHIVRIYDFVDDGEGAAISMEFVDGTTLAEERMQRSLQIFSTGELSPWLNQVSDALDYAHSYRRLVHRDLKPANLMLDRHSGIKVADFGIARSLTDTMSRVSTHGTTSGTLLYMSPQQAMGERPKPTDDIYSLGATLYELLAGKPPFYSGDISRQITTRIAPSIRERREELELQGGEDIPEDWERVIADCLNKDPAARPQTAGEVAERLGLRAPKTAPSSRPSTAKSVPVTHLTPQSKTVQPAEERKKSGVAPWMIFSGVGGAIAAVGIFAFWWTNRPASWVINVEPAGSSITLAGRTVSTPATFSDLKAGTYTAILSAEGYEQQTLPVELKAGQAVSATPVSLVRSSGKLILNSTPSGASYRIAPISGSSDEAFVGKTPESLSLPVGGYEATVEHAGEVKVAKFTIARNSTFEKSIDFPPPAPTIAVVPESTPPAPPAPTPAPVIAPAPSPAPAPLAAQSTSPTPAPAPMAAQDMPPAPVAQNSSPGPAPTAPTSPAVPPADAAATAFAAGPGAQPAADAPGNTTPGGPLNPQMAAALTQAGALVEPDQGYWPLDGIFADSPFTGYSESGQGYVLYKAQEKMKEGGFYDSRVDGKPGKGTHKAIQAYQTANSLPASGRLDDATISTMGLTALEDKSSWKMASSSTSSSSSRKRSSSGNSTPESEKTLFRKKAEQIIGRDLRDINPFKRR